MPERYFIHYTIELKKLDYIVEEYVSGFQWSLTDRQIRQFRNETQFTKLHIRNAGYFELQTETSWALIEY